MNASCFNNALKSCGSSKSAANNHQIVPRALQCALKSKYCREKNRNVAGLDLLHRADIEVGELRQPFLRQIPLHPHSADVGSKGHSVGIFSAFRHAPLGRTAGLTNTAQRGVKCVPAMFRLIQGFLSLAGVILVVSALTTIGCAQQHDGADAQLEKAKVAFNEQQDAARKRLLAAYAELLKSLSAANRMQESVKVGEDLKAFEEKGILLGTQGLQKPISEYGKAIKAARDGLSASYDAAIKQLTTAGQAARASELLKEYSDLAFKSRLMSLTMPGKRNLFLMHGGYVLWAKPMDSDGARLNATFELVPGLANGGAVSFRVVNVPDHFLAHGDFRLKAVRFDPGDGFRKNATFKQVKGLGSGTGVSFESYNFPGYFIRVRGNGEAWVDKNDGSVAFRSEATFQITEPRYRLW